LDLFDISFLRFIEKTQQKATTPPPGGQPSFYFATAATMSITASSNSKRILITGCSSGIGLEAAKMLFFKKYKLILVARTKEKAEAAKEHIILGADDADAIQTFGCDMSSFESVRECSSKIHDAMGSGGAGGAGIDVMCLNAGMCMARGAPAPAITPDGIELTLATNHFGPFLLTNLLLDLMNKGGRIVMTGSGVHKKSTFGDFKGIAIDDDGNAIPPSIEKPLININGSEWEYYQAYAQSKLCNIAVCMELNRRLEEKGIVANCFCPGLITSTGLFANQPYIFRTLFGVMANHVFTFGDTVEWGGGALAWLASSDDAAAGGLYWKNPTSGGSRKGNPKYGVDFQPMDASEEAGSEENQAKLWALSAALTGVE
jgi:protochlorophyllide reductase